MLRFGDMLMSYKYGLFDIPCKGSPKWYDNDPEFKPKCEHTPDTTKGICNMTSNPVEIFFRAEFIPAVVMVTYNRRDATKRSIESIIENTAIPPYKFVIVDNNSTDGTKEYLDTLPENIYRIYYEYNAGLTFASNRGFGHCDIRDTVRINNDVQVLTYNWLNIMRNCIQEDTGMVVPVYEDPGAWIHQRTDIPERDRLENIRCAVGHCMLITKKMRNLGFEWCEELGIVGPCDLDASMFCRKHNLKIVVAHDVKMRLIDCKPGPEYWKEHEEVDWEKGRDYLKNKYGKEIYEWVIG